MLKKTAVFVVAQLAMSLIKTSAQDTYTPDDQVKNGHAILPVQNSSLTVSYALGLIISPLIILGLFCCAVFSFQFSLCCRACFHKCCPNTCLRCYNQKSAEVETLEERKKYHWRARFGFFACIFAALASSCLMYVGNVELINSLNTLSYAVSLSGQISLNIYLDTKSTAAAFYNLTNATLSYPCVNAFQYLGTSDQLTSYSQAGGNIINTVAGYLEPISPALEDVETTINEQGTNNVKIVLNVVFAFMIIPLGLLLIAYFSQLKTLLTVAIIWSEIMILVLVLLAAIEMFLLHGLSDYCISPSGNTVTFSQNFGAPTIVQQIIAFYTGGCTGTNPIQVDYDQAFAKYEQINQTWFDYYPGSASYLELNGFSTSCLTKGSRDVQSLRHQLKQLAQNFECGTIYPIFDQGVQMSTCTDAVNGLFWIWISHLVTAVFLFIAVCAATFFYEMFDPTKHTILPVEASQELDEESRGDAKDNKFYERKDDIESVVGEVGAEAMGQGTYAAVYLNDDIPHEIYSGADTEDHLTQKKELWGVEPADAVEIEQIDDL